MSEPIDYVAEGEENEALRWRDAEIASLRVKLDAVCKAGYLTKLPSGQALDLSSLDVIDADGSRAHIRGENQGWFSVAKEDFEALRTYALAAALKGEK